MIVSGFDSGYSYSNGPLGYLLQKEGRTTEPKVLRGDPYLIGDLIDSSPRRWKYTSGVLRFHTDDQPTDAQLQEIMDAFEGYMFAGKSRETFDILWVLHTDKVDTELHFLVPRVDLETGQDLNIAPPGYADQFKVWAEHINTSYGFVNPLTRVAKSKPKQEATTRAEKRKEVQSQMMALLDNGKIKSRRDLIDALNRVGKVRSDNPNVKHISVGFVGFENNMRMSGGMFERGFDFVNHRPARSQRSTPSMSDYLAEKPKIKRALHRFEEPHADPFGDQDAYLQDIAERLSAAFEYRKTRFERIRAGSRKLAELRKQAINVEALTEHPPAPEIQEKAEDDVERIAQARRRARERKSKIAQIAGTQQHLSSRCRDALERIGNYLRAAHGKVVDFLRRRTLKPDARPEPSLLGSLETVGQESGLDDWLEQLDRIARRFARTKGDVAKGEFEQAFRSLLQKRPGVLPQVESVIASLPTAHQQEIRYDIAEIIEQEIDRLRERYPSLFKEPPDASRQIEGKDKGTSKLTKDQDKPPDPF